MERLNRPAATAAGAAPAADLLAKEPARIAGMFDTIAARYDTLNHLLSAGLDRRWRARAITALRFAGRETFLDLCTGTADVAIAALEGRPGPRRVIGVDFAGEMLRLGQVKVAAKNLQARAALIRGDVTRIPLASQSVDAIAVAFGIRNVEEPLRALRDMFRVLRAGGRLAILEFGLPRVPVLRSAYLWYFRRVLPRIGGLFSRHSEAYSYLPASVSVFPSPDEVCTMLRQQGYSDVTAVPLTLGVVYLYTAVRP